MRENVKKTRLLPIGLAGLLVAAGCATPVVWLAAEGDAIGGPATAVGAFAALLGIAALIFIAIGVWRRAPAAPAGARIALLANMIFLACFALEISDGLVRRGGVFHWFSSGMFVLTLILLVGNLTARRWAWWACRILAGLGIAWFLLFAAVIPWAPLQAEGSPTPWYGRAWMIFVSFLFAGVMMLALRALGQIETRRYFGFEVDPQELDCDAMSR